MSSPQLEDGYLKIANIIIDKLIAYHLSPSEMKCVLFIIRKTYGYNKKEDMIANSQFCDATGLDKSNVCRAIRGLIDKRVVVKNDNTRITTYGFNKHYSKWKVLSKTTTVVKNDNKLLSKMTNTKDNYTKDNKENIQKKSNGRFKKPSLEEIKEYCLERKNGVNPETFFDFYEAKDWYIGKNKMKNFQAAIRTWEKNNPKPRGEFD